MADKRVTFSLAKQLDDFLESESRKTGIDKSNIMRTWIWEKMQAERDRKIAERQLASSDVEKPEPRKAKRPRP